MQRVVVSHKPNCPSEVAWRWFPRPLECSGYFGILLGYFWDILGVASRFQKKSRKYGQQEHQEAKETSATSRVWRQEPAKATSEPNREEPENTISGTR